MTIRVGTMNEQKDLPDPTAEEDLRLWLTEDRPHLAGLNEWESGRNYILRRLVKEGTHNWARPVGGGPVALWQTGLGRELVNCYGHELVGEEFVGRLPGRKSVLPPSITTVAKFTDGTALLVTHMTAEVQDRHGNYHDDECHAARVRRHKKERRRLRRLVRKLRRRGWEVYVVGDTNYQDMTLRPLISCWQDKPHQGTLGGRCVDYVYAERESSGVRTFKGRSDHKAVVAIYA